MLPLSATEQQQLRHRNFDNLITLHQRKYNKLLNVKKSMLEKMFPKKGITFQKFDSKDLLTVPSSPPRNKTP